MPTRATGMGATCLGWRWWWGYRRRYASERSSGKPTRWRLSCALIWTCCWHWRPCIGAAGGGSSAVDCVEEAIVMVVVEMGCRRRCSCSSGRSSGKPTRWRLRCALIRPCCWHWRPCIGAAGGGSSAVDCVGGEAIVMSVDGLSASLQQREERQEATQWRLGYQDQLIEHRQERRHAPGGRSKGSGSSSWRPRPPRLDSHSRRHRFICAQRSP